MTLDDVRKLSAQQIIAIPESEPERLFYSPISVRATFVELAKLWHPDHFTLNQKIDRFAAQDVMAHINRLYQRALDKVKAGTWQEPDTVDLYFSHSKRTFRFHYLRKHDFALGQLYVSSNRVVYTYDKQFSAEADQYVLLRKDRKFPTEKVEKAFTPLLPNKVEFAQQNALEAVLISKPREQLLLKDVVAHFKGEMPIFHTVWVINRCLGICAWLDSCSIFYGGFSLDNLFINPADHTVSVLGGWFYSTVADAILSLLPERTQQAAPLAVLQPKRDGKFYGTTIVDRYLVRRLLCELLGDSSGTSFLSNPDIPRSIEQWINLPPAKDPIDDWRLWLKAVEQAFGARKFVELKLTEQDIYQRR